MGKYTKCKWCGKKFEKSGWNQFVSHNTFGIGGKESYCSKACKQAAEAAKSDNPVPGNATTPIIKDKEEQLEIEEARIKAENKKLKLEQQKIKAEEKRRLEGKIDEIATISFSDDKAEIENKINELVVLASSKPTKQIKKAIIEKIEFGIMKLKTSGANSEAEYFEEKLKSIKKFKIF